MVFQSDSLQSQWRNIIVPHDVYIFYNEDHKKSIVKISGSLEIKKNEYTSFALAGSNYLTM